MTLSIGNHHRHNTLTEGCNLHLRLICQCLNHPAAIVPDGNNEWSMKHKWLLLAMTFGVCFLSLPWPTLQYHWKCPILIIYLVEWYLSIQVYQSADSCHKGQLELHAVVPDPHIGPNALHPSNKYFFFLFCMQYNNRTYQWQFTVIVFMWLQENASSYARVLTE